MDNEIGDILDSVSGPADFSSPESTAADYQALTRFWVAERSAPEVLPYPTDLMERMLDRVRKQISTIEDLTSSPAATNPNSTGSNNANLTLSILQTDLSRTQYLLRSLLRQRLSKLTAHALHYLSSSSERQRHSETLSSSNPPLLSPTETSFLQTHHALLASHYRDAFLNAFPQNLQRLDDNAGGVSMVEGPDAKKAVFVRCLVRRWRGGISGVDVDEHEHDEEGMGGEGHLSMRSGEVWVVRWEDVKKGVLAGQLELL